MWVVPHSEGGRRRWRWSGVSGALRSPLCRRHPGHSRGRRCLLWCRWSVPLAGFGPGQCGPPPCCTRQHHHGWLAAVSGSVAAVSAAAGDSAQRMLRRSPLPLLPGLINSSDSMLGSRNPVANATAAVFRVAEDVLASAAAVAVVAAAAVTAAVTATTTVTAAVAAAVTTFVLCGHASRRRRTERAHGDGGGLPCQRVSETLLHAEAQTLHRTARRPCHADNVGRIERG